MLRESLQLFRYLLDLTLRLLLFLLRICASLIKLRLEFATNILYSSASQLFCCRSRARCNGFYILFQLLGYLPDSVRRVRLELPGDLLHLACQNICYVRNAYV